MHVTASQTETEESGRQGIAHALTVLNQRIVNCRKCPRLVRYREEVARVKRRAFQDCTYWGRPVPGIGDPASELLILGLAPAAHGANRTGRMFTGDRSGDFLYKALYRAGFANLPTSTHSGDGLRLSGAYITATLRCAPPANKPLLSEIANCRPYLEMELELLRPRAVLALGGIAFHGYLKLLKQRRELPQHFSCKFRHGVSYQLPGGPNCPGPRLFASYHPSQQNTFTGKLTHAMLLRVLRQVRRFLNDGTPAGF